MTSVKKKKPGGEQKIIDWQDSSIYINQGIENKYFFIKINDSVESCCNVFLATAGFMTLGSIYSNQCAEKDQFIQKVMMS